jgi:hypothetical protein
MQFITAIIKILIFVYIVTSVLNRTLSQEKKDKIKEGVSSAKSKIEMSGKIGIYVFPFKVFDVLFSAILGEKILSIKSLKFCFVVSFLIILTSISLNSFGDKEDRFTKNPPWERYISSIDLHNKTTASSSADEETMKSPELLKKHIKEEYKKYEKYEKAEYQIIYTLAFMTLSYIFISISFFLSFSIIRQSAREISSSPGPITIIGAISLSSIISLIFTIISSIFIIIISIPAFLLYLSGFTILLKLGTFLSVIFSISTIFFGQLILPSWLKTLIFIPSLPLFTFSIICLFSLLILTFKEEVYSFVLKAIDLSLKSERGPLDFFVFVLSIFIAILDFIN